MQRGKNDETMPCEVQPRQPPFAFDRHADLAASELDETLQIWTHVWSAMLEKTP